MQTMMLIDKEDVKVGRRGGKGSIGKRDTGKEVLTKKSKYEKGFSYLLCHSCGMKKDADTNAGYNIATRCRDDRLKAGMITVKNGVSL